MDIDKESFILHRLKVAELRKRYAEVFGVSTRSNNRTWLIKKILWKLQANCEGGISEEAIKRAEEIADESEIRSTAPRERKSHAKREERIRDPRLPKVGSTIFRPYKGTILEVKVLEDGFEYSGEHYHSLSALAKKITGSKAINGLLFFKLTGRKANAE